MVKITKMPLAHLICLGLFYSVLASSMIAPIANEHFITGLADYTNHLASLIQSASAFLEGQFPLRVSPYDNHGWRYPLFQFYSPTTYTLSGALYHFLLPNQPLLAYKLTVILSLLIGCIYFHRFAALIINSQKAALLSTVVYISSPYLIMVTDYFSDLSEVMALGLLPVILFYSFKAFLKSCRLTSYLGIAFLWYLLLTIHLLTFLYSAIFIFSWLSLLTIKNPHHFKKLIFLGVSVFLSCLLAAWYIVPVAWLGKYFLISKTFNLATAFVAFSPLLPQLIFPGVQSFHDPLSINHPPMGLFIVSGFVIALYAFFNQAKIKSKRANYLLGSLLALFLFIFFVIWSPINFWQFLPQPFLIIQYSWRLLGQLSWVGAILVGFSACWIFQDKIERWQMIVGVLLIIASTSFWFPTPKDSNLNKNKFLTHPELTYNKNAYTINFDQHIQFVNNIGHLALYKLSQKNQLQTNLPFTIPRSLFYKAYQPYLFLKGTVPSEFKQHWILEVVLNNKTIKQISLKPGPIQFKLLLDAYKNLDNWTLQFNIKNPLIQKKDPLAAIKINALYLTGFIHPQKTWTLKEVTPLCKQKGKRTLCQLPNKADMTLIELPILYYPKLLSIYLNGKTIPYQSIVYSDNLITTIRPEAGKINNIKIEFVGLPWANQISLYAWIGSVGLILILWFNYIINIVFNQKGKKFEKLT